MTAPAQAADRPRHPSTAFASFLVASGILLTRVFGLVRVRVFSHYFGQRSEAAEAFNAAFRIPNLLQNLFGEGALSASFIPVYARLIAEGDEAEAKRVAGAVFGLLALALSVLVLLGVVAAPLLIDLFAPGFRGPKRELTLQIVRPLFPGAAVLVLSAWCLGILNSHRKFLLSYTAPVLWNVAMIAALVALGPRYRQWDLAAWLAWASVVGAVLQFAIQLPTVVRLVGRLRISLDTTSAHVRAVLANFLPALFGRGVVQVSAYVDQIIASYLPTGAVTGLTNASLLYALPVALFGMSVSAAELPAMSSAVGSQAGVAEQLRGRLNTALGRVAFFIVPSAVAFLVLGDVIAAAILQTGLFTRADSVYVWAILAGSSVGLLATTLGRLYVSTFYALRDTGTPLRFALIRVTLTAALGYLAALPLPRALGIDPLWGAAGLTASAGIAGWVEFALLRRRLNRRIGHTAVPGSVLARLWLGAALAAGIAWTVKLAVGGRHPVLVGAAVLAPYGAVYLGVTWLLGVSQVTRLAGLVRRVR